LIDWSASLGHSIPSFLGPLQFATCTFQSFRGKGAHRFELPLISLEAFRGTPFAYFWLAEQLHVGKADRRIFRRYILQWNLSVALVDQNGHRWEPFNLYDGGIWVSLRESLDTGPCAERHRCGRRTRTVHLDSDLCALEAARKDSVTHSNPIRQSP